MQVAQQLKQEPPLDTVINSLLYNNALRSNEGKQEYELPTAFEQEKIKKLKNLITPQVMQELNSKNTTEQKLWYLSTIWQRSIIHNI